VPQQDEVVITGMEFASSLGCEKVALRKALLTGQRGLTHKHRFQEWLQAPLGELPWDKLGITAADLWNTDAMLLEACKRILSQLLDQTRLLQRYPRERIGLWVGTTTSGIKGFYRTAQDMKSTGHEPSPLFRPDMHQARLAQDLSQALHLEGPAWTFCTSCAASAQAFGLGAEAVRCGMIDAAIVIGADILNLVTLLGFEALQLLDHDFCNPFQPERKGINLAEAIVIFSLERQALSNEQIVFRGFQSYSEAYHMTQPAPQGAWMQKTMEGVLAQCRIHPDDISYINPHGTGTQANDSCEITAIHEIFGNSDRVHATKKLTGHPLGASGALELAITALMLPTLTTDKRRFGLSNSFGFGGANVSILLESVP